jgi:hypothetical protein
MRILIIWHFEKEGRPESPHVMGILKKINHKSACSGSKGLVSTAAGSIIDCFSVIVSKMKVSGNTLYK